MNERHIDWYPLPPVRRWEDFLPDLSRTPFINPVISIPREKFFAHVNDALNNLYGKQREAYRKANPTGDYRGKV